MRELREWTGGGINDEWGFIEKGRIFLYSMMWKERIETKDNGNLTTWGKMYVFLTEIKSKVEIKGSVKEGWERKNKRPKEKG